MTGESHTRDQTVQGAPYEKIWLESVETHVFRAPLSEPVRTSFGVMHDRPAVLVRLVDETGLEGWGEVWCNFPACGAEHRARLVDTVLAPVLLGQPLTTPAEDARRLAMSTRILALQTREFGPLAQACAGADIALWDLFAQRQGLPIHRLLSDSSRHQVPLYASGINPSDARETVARCRQAGYESFKVKIGFDDHADLRVTQGVAAELTSTEALMLDANQAWPLERASRMARALADFGPRWLEEPMPVDAPGPDWEALALASPVPLAGGENLASQKEFEAVIEAGTLQVLQPDACKWGGITRCYEVGRRASETGRRYCPHYLGGGIGLVASAHLLAAVGGDGLLEVDVNPNPLREMLATPFPAISAGQMTLSQAPGLGVVPDLASAERWRCLTLKTTRQ